MNFHNVHSWRTLAHVGHLAVEIRLSSWQTEYRKYRRCIGGTREGLFIIYIVLINNRHLQVALGDLESPLHLSALLPFHCHRLFSYIYPLVFFLPLFSTEHTEHDHLQYLHCLKSLKDRYDVSR